MRPWLLLIFFSLSKLATAQVTEASIAFSKQKKDSIRSLDIERFPDYFFIWPLIKQRSTVFEIQQLSNRSNKITYRPNNSVGLGFGLYVFEIGAEITFAVPINSEKESLYGKTGATDFQLNLLGKNWGVDLFYQNYNGFYLDDPTRTTLPGAPLPQRADMGTNNLGINGIYAFNKKFSLRSSYNFSERQRKSAGSFLLAGTTNFFKVRGDSAAYSKGYNTLFGESAAFSELNMNTVSISPGYSYTLVIKNFFTNASLSFGPAYHWIDYEVNGQKYSTSSLNYFLDIRAGVGYNAKRFFCGMNLVSQARIIRFENIQFTSSSTTFKLLVGYRFKEFGFLKWRAIDLLPSKK